MNHLALPSFSENGHLNAVIEIPAGTNTKFEYDKQRFEFKPDVREGVTRRVDFLSYPLNYGFVPSTKMEKSRGGDGDPLDVLVLGAEPVPPMCVVAARAIGLMTMKDNDELDHKIVAVHVNDPEFNSYHDVHQLPPHKLAVIKRFFEDYKSLEHKRVVVDDILPVDYAYPVIEHSLAIYQKWKAGEDISKLLHVA